MKRKRSWENNSTVSVKEIGRMLCTGVIWLRIIAVRSSYEKIMNLGLYNIFGKFASSSVTDGFSKRTRLDWNSEIPFNHIVTHSAGFLQCPSSKNTWNVYFQCLAWRAQCSTLPEWIDSTWARTSVSRLTVFRPLWARGSCSSYTVSSCLGSTCNSSEESFEFSFLTGFLNQKQRNFVSFHNNSLSTSHYPFKYLQRFIHFVLRTGRGMIMHFSKDFRF